MTASPSSAERRAHLTPDIADTVAAKLVGEMAERWRQGSKLRRGHEGEIDLQSAGEEKYAVNPRAGRNVKMVQGEMPMVHARRPIGEHVR